MPASTPPEAARATPSAEQIDALLARLRETDALGRAERRYEMLAYLLREEAEGRGDRIKAYALGTEVLGRGADFDPSTDSIVRAEIGRVRDALALFYTRPASEGQIRVSIPKGTYRPVVAPPGNAPAPARPARRRPRWARPLAAAALVLAAGTTGIVSAMRPEPLGPEEAPLLEVAAFDVAPPVADAGASLSGLRARLAQDLAGLGMLRVRTGSAETPPDYVLDASLEPGRRGPLLLIALTENPEGEILWSRRIDLPADENAFYGAIASLADAIANEVGGRHGVISRDQLARLRGLAAEDRDAPRATYACLLLAHEFDLTKAPKAGRAARGCLGGLVASGSRDAEVWSQWALMLFLDAAGIGAGRPAPGQLEDALAAAQTAIRLDPYDAGAHEVAGSVNSALGNGAAALASYERALELAPANLFIGYQLGWQQALAGEWDAGLARMREVIDQMGVVPPHMRVPLSMDRFVAGDYEGALAEGLVIAQGGDARGADLAYAAAMAAGDCEEAGALASGADGLPAADPHLPLRRVRVTFSDPPPLAAYEAALARSPCATPPPPTR